MIGENVVGHFFPLLLLQILGLAFEGHEQSRILKKRSKGIQMKIKVQGLLGTQNGNASSPNQCKKS
jgi:hypothetical protein